MVGTDTFKQPLKVSINAAFKRALKLVPQLPADAAHGLQDDGLLRLKSHSPTGIPFSSAVSVKSSALTKAPLRQPRSSTSPHTTSRGASPAIFAISSKLRLLSRPIVQTAPGRSSGRGRYLPFPVPLSRPTQPVGSSDRKVEIIGHGWKGTFVGR